MAGASDKARFYMEQSVPELQDLQRKKIFSEVRYSIPHTTLVQSESYGRKKSLQLRRKGRTLSISSMLEAHSLLTTLAMWNMK